MKHTLLLIPFLLIALVGCKSTQKAYESGDYERAVFNSIERLRKSPDNKKSRETLKDAYPSLVDYFKQQIDQKARSANPLRWESVADDYALLNRVYNEIQRSPSAKKLLTNAVSFQAEYNESLLKAADARYALGNQGLVAGRNGDRVAAKQAFYHFQKVLELRPGYRDSQSLMNEAQDLATLYVQIEPIPMHSRTLGLTNEFFQNQLVEYMRTNQFSPFIRFFAPNENIANSRQPDQILVMQFDEFVVGQAYVKETVLQRVKENVEVGTVKVNEDSTAKVYGTVKAEMHQFYKQITSGGLLDVRIIDKRTNAVLSQNKFPGTFEYYDYWGFFNGDNRALLDEDKRYINKRQPNPDPSPQTLFIEFTKPIYSQVTNFVGAYYRNM